MGRPSQIREDWGATVVALSGSTLFLMVKPQQAMSDLTGSNLTNLSGDRDALELEDRISDSINEALDIREHLRDLAGVLEDHLPSPKGRIARQYLYLLAHNAKMIADEQEAVMEAVDRLKNRPSPEG
jgi:hypothetical protein